MSLDSYYIDPLTSLRCFFLYLHSRCMEPWNTDCQTVFVYRADGNDTYSEDFSQ